MCFISFCFNSDDGRILTWFQKPNEGKKKHMKRSQKDCCMRRNTIDDGKKREIRWDRKRQFETESMQTVANSQKILLMRRLPCLSAFYLIDWIKMYHKLRLEAIWFFFFGSSVSILFIQQLHIECCYIAPYLMDAYHSTWDCERMGPWNES